MKILPRSFYKRTPELVAPDLLGKLLMRKINGTKLIGKIVEVEAYLGEHDEAAHAFVGKTKRNQSLYLDGGHAYVHQIHRYFCLDVVCQSKDIAGSVLIRAIEPVEGIDIMKEKRKKKPLTDLCSGPGKTGMAFGIDKLLDGVDLCNEHSPLSIWEDEHKEEFEVESSTRIGISKTVEKELRFCVEGSEFLSR